ncbi:MAG TPA: Gfo/Idh/MocA family oxidoreductase [Acetobacteraceae bacterium]|nr:Gfo/Idh/MocA family oxidoreductase [Acetobacteraceae bacterium]
MPDDIRFGLIGYGLWGRHHATAIAAAPGATLSAIACASETTATAARQDFPTVPVDIGYEPLLSRPDIDAVAIVIPNHLHAKVGVAALRAGKDVLLEKPMATTLEGCDQLLQAEHQSGRVLTIGHELRLSTQFGRIKSFIDAGEIGKPSYLSLSLFRFPFRPGSQGWRYDAARVGSWLLEEPVHAFDFVMWYFETLGDPLSIQVFGNASMRGAAMAESFTAILRFPGDAHAVITQTVGGFEYHQLLNVVGSEGSVRSWWSGAMDRTTHPAYELRIDRRSKGGVETAAIGPSGELAELSEQARRTVVAFRNRRPLLCGEAARKRIIVCLAAEESLHEGREIVLRF